ncbi:hypothetical protein D3C87_1727210 [compost metagenome]
MKLDEGKSPAGLQHGSDASGPKVEVGKPAYRAIGCKDAIESHAALSGAFEPLEKVGAFEGRGNAAFARKPLGEGDRLVGNIDAGHLRAEADEAQTVLAGVALQMQEIKAGQVAEQLDLFGIERRTAVAEERCLVTLVAVVRDGRGVP